MSEDTPHAPEMYLVSVTPITRSPLGDSLTYFSKEELAPGTLVEIPLRGRELYGLVLSCESVLDMKAAIKSAPFAIKKIEAVKSGRIFDEPFLRAVEKTAGYFVGSTGAILRAHIQDTILEEWDGLLPEATERGAQKGPAEQLLLQATLPERESAYRSKIREAFAKKRSLHMVIPHKALIADMATRLSRGIDEYLVVLQGDLPKKELIANWKRALAIEHPILIISTPHYLSLPRADIGTYILEYESHGGYRSLTRPFFDARILAQFLAKERSAELISADTFLSFEALHTKDLGTSQTLAPLKHRLLANGETRLVDLTKKRDKKELYFFSDELLAEMKEALGRTQNIFLFTTRKGIAPLTVCNDCGTTITCPGCGRPLVLHTRPAKKKESVENIFICHSCKKEYPPDTRCAHCNSWRLVPLGVGTERIAAAVAEQFPRVPLFALDSDSTKTPKQATTAAEAFHASAGAILIGTEMALPYLEHVATSAVISADNLFAIPDFAITERLMHTLIAIREKTDGMFLIQTRKPEMRVFAHAVRGTLFDFYREEMETRKKFQYPPFSIFIKITRQGKSVEVHADMDELEALLAEWKPDLFSGFASGEDGNETLHALIRLRENDWPNEKLLTLLVTLPPKFLIEVAPEQLF